MDLANVISERSAVKALASALRAGRHAVASGQAGSSTHLLAAAIARLTGRTILLVVAHLDEADEALDELQSLESDAIGAGLALRLARLPGLEVLPGETSVSGELLAERLAVVRQLRAWTSEPDRPGVIIAPIQALMQTVPAQDQMASLCIELARGQTQDMNALLAWLQRAGYQRLDAAEEPGDIAVRGGIVDIFPAAGFVEDASGLRAAPAAPIRLDFFGNTIDRLDEVDPETMGSVRELARAELLPAAFDHAAHADAGQCFVDLLPPSAVALIAETMEVTEQGRGYYERVTDSRGVLGPPAVFRSIKARCAAIAEINQFSAGSAAASDHLELPFRALGEIPQDAADAVRALAAGTLAPRCLVCCQNAGELQRLNELLADLPSPGGAPPGSPSHPASNVEARIAYVHRGFVLDADQGSALAIVPYHELLHRYHTRRRAVRLRAARAMDTFLDIAPGDYVVHAEHGIARFVGMGVIKAPRRRAPAQGEQVPAPLREARRTHEPEEYLTLEFAGGSKLHVPALQIDQVQRYVGGFKGKPQLSTLGGQRWKAQKQRVAESVRDLAAQMLRVRAAREHMPGIRYPGDTAWMKEFEAEFPYEETEDQLAAIAEIKKDMESPRPMDRLVCGDVGFGKTELAIRAAFKAAEFGKQVAVLVPTTVLAEQHERTLRSRLAGYPFRIESLSRFKSDAQQRQIVRDAAKGHVDILVGTHRILSEDVRFADLGLVVIDEEQRFGVEHKERLLRLRLTVDVLTLSATPIPRTLHMSMLGLRDISSLTTAPLDRRAIVTEVIPFNQRRLQQAIARELAREGQVYVVHNRISDIFSVADSVQRLAPGARVVVGHGQMDPGTLEDVMLRFMRRDADILVSTTIIESGIDIPTANTIIINDADRFGLADLHQLRGRVGRSKHRAYCYLMLPTDRPLKETARKRLKAIEQYSMLGAGFKIAMRDLEIRGAGNLLGPEQSGHIAAVGYEMYCRLLDRAVRELKGELPPITISATGIDIGITGVLPKSYIPSDPRRLDAYRRIATAADADDLARVAADLRQAYGEPPPAVERLLQLAQLRTLAARLGVRSITLRGQDVLLRVDRPEPLERRLRAKAATPPSAPESPSSPIQTSAHFTSASDRARSARGTRPQHAGGLVGLRPTPERPHRSAPAQPRGSAAPELTIRVLPPPSGESLHEVYLRLPTPYLEPESLLRVLLRRLAEPASTAAQAP